jgi:potassium channel LctB
LGYTNVRHYVGGLADWKDHGGAIECNAPPVALAETRAIRQQTVASRLSWLEVLANWPLERLVGFWVGMILVFGIIYWLAGINMSGGLKAGNNDVHPDLSGFATAIYFSFVTALSIGYGDVVPVGALRILAITEGIAGLLVFGCVISKLVSRRQEELTAEIHRTTFEDRLDRVRTNLHLVFSDLGSVQQLQVEQGALPQQVLRRLESTVRVFRGELQTIHDLLYKSHIEPDEDTLESILANLLICLQTLAELSESCPEENSESANLDVALHAIANLAREICGECVPRVYAPALKGAMDQIQSLAKRLAE